MEEDKDEIGISLKWTLVFAFLLFLALLAYSLYEQAQLRKDVGKIAENSKAAKILKLSEQKDLCECPKPKAKVAHKKAKPKQKSVPKKVAKSEPVTIVPSIVSTAIPKVEVVAEAQKEDFYDKAVMPKTWVTEPEEEVAEVEPPRVGRKILVIRQQPVMPYYGGYSSGYYPSYAPQVTYGQPYIPPPQTVFVPSPPVIVHAPSVVTPAPSVVTPAGGYKPQGSTGGHSPSGTTGTAL